MQITVKLSPSVGPSQTVTQEAPDRIPGATWRQDRDWVQEVEKRLRARADVRPWVRWELIDMPLEGAQ